MDWGRNLIPFRTANFLLNRLQTFLIWSWKDNLLSIVKPRHLHEGLSSMVLVPYLRAGGGPIKIDLHIIIASVFDWWAISLLAVHHMCSWDRIHRSEVACVASVPVRAEQSIGPREGVFAFGTRGKGGESKKDEVGGGGRGGKGTLARKPLYSEKRPPTFTVDFSQWLTVYQWVNQL